MKITRINIYTGEQNTMEVNISPVDFQKWRNEEISLWSLPLSTAERDFLTMGITPATTETILDELIASGEIEDEEYLLAMGSYA